MYVELNSDIYDENNKYFLRDLSKLLIDSPNQQLFDRVLLHRILFNKDNIKNYNYELVTNFLFDFEDLEIKFIISKIKMIETIYERKYEYGIIYQKYNLYIVRKKYYKIIYNLFKNHKEPYIRTIAYLLLKKMRNIGEHYKYTKYFIKAYNKNQKKNLTSFNI